MLGHMANLQETLRSGKGTPGIYILSYALSLISRIDISRSSPGLRGNQNGRIVNNISYTDDTILIAGNPRTCKLSYIRLMLKEEKLI